MYQLPECDWKVLRNLEPELLDRFCKRVLDELQSIAADAQKSNHKRYGDIYALIRDRDKELANAFDGLSRSCAYMKLTIMHSYQLLTPEELNRFTPETINRIKSFASI